MRKGLITVSVDEDVLARFRAQVPARQRSKILNRIVTGLVGRNDPHDFDLEQVKSRLEAIELQREKLLEETTKLEAARSRIEAENEEREKEAIERMSEVKEFNPARHTPD